MVCGLLAAGLLALGVAGSAEGAIGHRFSQSIAEAPPGVALGEPGALAVERSSGRVFLADTGRGVVDVFDASGGFEGQFGGGALTGAAGLAVDEETGDVYIAEPFADVVYVFRPGGPGVYTELSEWTGVNISAEGFGEVAGVAVDNSKSVSDPHAGDVYLVDSGGNTVDIFKPKPAGGEEGKEGSFVEPLSGGKLEEPNGVTIDPATGEVYVADSVAGAIDVYGSGGKFERKLNGAGSPQGTFEGSEEEEGNVTAVAVDPGSGEIYVAESGRRVLGQFDAEGKWIGQVAATPTGGLGEPRGVALAATAKVYLADASAHLLDVFGPDVVVPDAKTGLASKVGKTSATLNGVVNADATATKYRFQWGSSEALGSETTSLTAGPGEEAVSSEVSGLATSTTYFFRIVAENENGASVGAIHSFTTAQPVEGLVTGQAQNVTPDEATLTGTLKPNGVDAHYYFQWGRTPAYGDTSPEPPADAGFGKAPIEAKTVLAALRPNTTYHYRLVAENEYGKSFGEDARFTTSGPPRIVNLATSVEGHEAVTLHAGINPDKLETKYHFEYGETTGYGSEVPLGGGSIPPGDAAVAESAALTKLRIGASYHFRVVASNEAGTTTGPDQTFTPLPAAPVESLSAVNVSASEATLQAQINPLGHDTTYFFQYGSESCATNPGTCSDTPTTPTDIGAGEAGVSTSAQLQALKPQTTYHYRVIAHNALGTTESAERTFTTQEAERPFALPDHRAWEMVSPPDKHGAPIEALTREGGLILAAEDGNAITYVANGALAEEGEEPNGNRSPEMQQILATRGPEKWSSQDIDTPQNKAQGLFPGAAPEYQFFSPQLEQALVQPPGPEPPLSPEATEKTVYLRDSATATFLPLVTAANVPPGTKFGGQIHPVAATPDLSHVVLHSGVPLATPPAGPGLYEWDAGKLQFLSMLPDGTPAQSASLGYASHVLANSVSSDGNRVIWANTPEGGGQGHLFMHTAATGKTVQLDAAQGVPEPGQGSAQFQTASTDGSKVFFTDKQRLTADSTAESFPEAPDLYECEITEEGGEPACHLRDLTVDENEGQHAAVQGLLLGASEEGTSVFLVAQGVLATNENGNGEQAQAGKDNLYGLQESAGSWRKSFVAQLSSEDSPEWEGGRKGESAGRGDTAFLTARVSPDGSHLAFMSAGSLTGYDNRDQSSGKRDEEVYLYDSQGASLTCVSCNPTGARPKGVLDRGESGEGLGLLVDRRQVWAAAGEEHYLAGSIPGWTAESLQTALVQSRYLSNSGRLFFNSPDSLVPAAKSGKESVYEYEPSGVGSCQSATGACVALISSGDASREAAFLEATPSGDDVYFLTAAQLLAQDTDTAFDIYDARVCSEQSPCQSPPAAEPEGCANAPSCRAAQPAQLGPVGGLATATTSGPGNITPGSGSPSGPPGKGKPKPLTRSQKLVKALKACKKLKTKHKRQACERKARKAYTAKHSARKSTVRRTASARARGARR